MSEFVDRCKGIWERLVHSPAQRRARFAIPSDRVDVANQLIEPLEADLHYFQVRVNEMWLAKSRRWFSQIDPMVTVVSEFVYGKEVQAVPFVVGPALMEKYGLASPAGMQYTDTRVAGLHPYRGGRVNLTVVLFEIMRTNHARDLLKLIERSAGALDFSSAVSSYLKIADVVLDGLESVLKLEGSQPCLGWRIEIDPDANEVIRPSYYALIDLAEDDPRLEKLWVRKNRLVIGETLEEAIAFREADFVLYSIVKDDVRSDLRTLPFYPIWERVQREAQQARPDAWKSAKANLLTLCQEMRLSPDITESHCTQLINDFMSKAKQRYEEAVVLSELGSDGTDNFQQIRGETLSILEM